MACKSRLIFIFGEYLLKGINVIYSLDELKFRVNVVGKKNEKFEKKIKKKEKKKMKIKSRKLATKSKKIHLTAVKSFCGGGTRKELAETIKHSSILFKGAFR